jgi:DUF1009 family protein
MAGQVKHNKIFSSIRPDWKLAKLLFSLPLKNTDSLIGAVARVLESEGIKLVDSTTFLSRSFPRRACSPNARRMRAKRRTSPTAVRSRARLRARSRPDRRDS